MTADNESCHHDRDGPRGVKRVGKGIASHHKRQGEEDLHLVIVDRLQHEVREVSQGSPQHCPTHSFFKEEDRDRARTGLAPSEHSEEDDEYDNADAVVEQGFACHFDLQALGCPGGPQDAEHGDRIGGGDQGAEQKTGEVGKVQADEAEDVVGECPHNEG